MSSMSTATATTSSSRLRKALWVSVGVGVSLILLALTVIWLSFKAKAEGLAVGYLQAASSAFQMGRPIPDTIFETGVYRVQVVSQGGASQTPVVITVYVKDRFFNQTFFEESRSVGLPTAR
jgi:hypothetical protein